VFALELALEFDDGVVVYLNSAEVGRSNMPSGSVDHETRAESSVDKLRRTLTIDPALLRTGKNVIAIEVHQASSSSSDLRLAGVLTASMLMPVLLFGSESSWTYDDDGRRDSGWHHADFDASAWAEGAGPLGTAKKVVTRIDSSVTTVYLRKTFDATEVDRLDALKLRLRDNDGYRVKLNGIVIAAVGLPPPPLKAKTPAVRSAPSHAWVTYVLPVAFVVEGENLLTVEIHRFEGTGSVRFDASLRALP
jgi:hypothetical protein